MPQLKEWPYEPFVERHLASVQLKKDLATITISAADLSIVVALTDITFMCTASGGGGEHFPKSIVDHISQGELGRMARVFHKSPGGPEKAFIFMEAGPKWLKLFLQVVKFCRWVKGADCDGDLQATQIMLTS